MVLNKVRTKKSYFIRLAITSDSNPLFFLTASIPSQRKLGPTQGINFLGHGLLYDHVMVCVYFATQPVHVSFSISVRFSAFILISQEKSCVNGVILIIHHYI